MISTPPATCYYTSQPHEYFRLPLNQSSLDYQPSSVDTSLLFDTRSNELLPLYIDDLSGDILFNDVRARSHTPSSNYNWDDELWLPFSYVYVYP